MVKKYFFSLFLILFAFQLSAATLDIEVQGITKGGILNLEISSSKEAFESDGDDTGVAARIQERVTKGQYQRSFDIPPWRNIEGALILSFGNSFLNPCRHSSVISI